ncbi:hypothetical protein L2D01_09890 [Hyphomonadaceae bacterium ML37]|nr:hypothetical protein L2D01_09890 [Hyphomonadaceae bacterium ML37]
MHSAMKGASFVLAIVGMLNWLYALYRTLTGTPFEDSLPLMIGGLVCFTLIVVLGAQSRKKP